MYSHFKILNALLGRSAHNESKNKNKPQHLGRNEDTLVVFCDWPIQPKSLGLTTGPILLFLANLPKTFMAQLVAR